MNTITIGGTLRADAALAAGRAPHHLKLARGAAKRIAASAKRVQQAARDGEWVYGVTTGFGSNAVKPQQCAG